MADSDDILQKILNEEDTTNINTEDINIDEILQETTDIQLNDDVALDFLDEKGKEFSELANKQGMSSASSLNAMLSSQERIEESRSKQKEQTEKLKKPIDFVQYMETDHIKEENKKISSTFYLKNHTFRGAKSGFSVLNFIPKTTLSSRFFKEGNIITSITAREDVIFTGNNLGKIRMYSCEKEYEYKALSNDEINASPRKAVVCMDVSDNIEFLIAGYMNGFIALWDLGYGKCKKLITNQHSDLILACKFLKIQNSVYDILSSDLSGVIKNINISEGYFFTSVTAEEINKMEDPVFFIEVLKLSSAEQALFDNPENVPLVVGLGSLNMIRIYQIEPVPKLLFELQKPPYITRSHIPDLAFGIGYPPRNTQNALLPAVKQQNNDDQTEIDLTVPHRLIAISWGRVLYIYNLPFSQYGAESPNFLGHYVNITHILRIGFISNSILYIFDMHKHFRILNSGLLTKGEIQFDPEDNTPISLVSKEFKPELEESQTIDQDILFQAYIPDNTDNDGKSTKTTYNNLIISQMKTLYILGKKHFHFGKLLNYEQCISNLQQHSEWMDALSLGLDIYHGRNITLADIPIDENERKTKVGFILKGLILQYTVNHTSSESLAMKKDKNIELISKIINICIEFCLDIGDVEYLFNQIEPIFITKNFENLFLEKLEPYILCGKINNKALPKKTLRKLINLYVKQGDFHTLSKLFSQLDIKNINNDEIKDLCITHNLLNPLIYLYMNNNEGNYFFPIQKIYNKYKTATPLNFDELKGYNDCLNKLSYIEIESSKQYLGHKLLWYINLCMKGKKYPTENEIEENHYSLLIQKILIWLLKEEIITDLLQFDSFTLFELLYKMFNDEHIYKHIEALNDININDLKSKLSNELFNDIQMDKVDVISIINRIVTKSKSINNLLVLQDMYTFITKISIDIKTIPKELIIETAVYLLEYDLHKTQLALEKDVFNLHNNNNTQTTLPNDINTMIATHKDELTTNELNQILQASYKTPSFIQVTLYLLKLTGNFEECLDTYLNNESIDNRKDNVFNFINSTLQSLKETKNKEKSTSFINSIMERIYNLANISISNLTEFTFQWLNDNPLTIIDKLSNDKQLQLNYLEEVLSHYKEDNIVNTEDNNLKTLYHKLLHLHIELLCKLNKTDLILDNLKSRQLYQEDEQCLPMCLEHKANDAAIYLYRLKGQNTEALNLSISILKEHLDQMLSYIIQDNRLEYENSIAKHEKHLDLCIDIAESNSFKDSPETEQMWFELLQIFYDMSLKIKENAEHNHNIALILNDYQKEINKNINLLIQQTNAYVSIRKIIDNFTTNYKKGGVKEFSEMLTAMLSSYEDYGNVLKVSKKIIYKTTEEQIEQFNQFIMKGNGYSLRICDQCQDMFIENHIKEKVHLFRCGHKIHSVCCLSEKDDIVCPICKKYSKENAEKIAMDVKRKSNRNVIAQQIKNDSAVKVKKNNNRNDVGKNVNVKGNQKKKNEEIFGKLKEIDKRFLTYLRCMEDDKKNEDALRIYYD